MIEPPKSSPGPESPDEGSLLVEADGDAIGGFGNPLWQADSPLSLRLIHSQNYGPLTRRMVARLRN